MRQESQVCSKEDAVKSLNIKRSVIVGGHKTRAEGNRAGPGCIVGEDGYRNRHDARTEKSVVGHPLVCTWQYSRSENEGIESGNRATLKGCRRRYRRVRST